MPLPSVKNGRAKRCEAICRARGDRCKNPAAFGMRTCRYHGARRPETVRSGDQHANYIHGWDSRQQREKRAKTLRMLRSLVSQGGLSAPIFSDIESCETSMKKIVASFAKVKES